MKASELEKVRVRLEEFIQDLTVPMGRSERRQWAGVYVRGLLLDGERKSAGAMAERLPDGDVQALQQFVGQSPWDHRVVREEMARRMAEELSPVLGWIVDDTGFPKQGKHSVGVARQYSGTLGKTGNCQVAVSLHMATEDASVPLDMSLYLPEEWTKDKERLLRAGVPEEETFKEKWRIALELIDRASAWDVPLGVVMADAAYGECTGFRQGLEERKLQYIMHTCKTLRGWTEQVNPPLRRAKEGKGRLLTRYDYSVAPETRSVQQVAESLPASAWNTVRWRNGSKGPLKSRFAATQFQPSHGHGEGKAPIPMGWLLVEWPDDESLPTKYWLSNLPPKTSLLRLVKTAKLRWRVERDYQELKDELGLDHYEGRSWMGWHHHVTLTMMAHAFLTQERLRIKKNFWLDSPQVAEPSLGETGNPAPSKHMDGKMPDVRLPRTENKK
jgi:SRSO17 transposase